MSCIFLSVSADILDNNFLGLSNNQIFNNVLCMKLDLKPSHPDWYGGAYARPLALFEQREFITLLVISRVL